MDPFVLPRAIFFGTRGNRCRSSLRPGPRLLVGTTVGMCGRRCCNYGCCRSIHESRRRIMMILPRPASLLGERDVCLSPLVAAFCCCCCALLFGSKSCSLMGPFCCPAGNISATFLNAGRNAVSPVVDAAGNFFTLLAGGDFLRLLLLLLLTTCCAAAAAIVSAMVEAESGVFRGRPRRFLTVGEDGTIVCLCGGGCIMDYNNCSRRRTSRFFRGRPRLFVKRDVCLYICLLLLLMKLDGLVDGGCRSGE